MTVQNKAGIPLIDVAPMTATDHSSQPARDDDTVYKTADKIWDFLHIQPSAPANLIADDESTASIANVFAYGAFADKHSGVVYHDLTGSFPFMSLDGSVCFFVLCLLLFFFFCFVVVSFVFLLLILLCFLYYVSYYYY